jgi:hypothetical protein
MWRRFSFLILGGLLLVPFGAAQAQGLKGEYFLGRTFTGTPVLTRTEVVNFNWGANSPDPATPPVVPVDNFCVRWTGSITAPESGSYVFATNSDDGVRLLLAGDWIINNWSDHSAALNTSSPIELEAGKTYGVRLEFYEAGGDAVIQLYWTPPGGTQQIIPADFLSTTYVRPVQARTPTPANRATDVILPIFMWSAGEGALLHNIYIGASPDLTPADLKGSRLIVTQYFYFEGITPGTTYYWRVDEIEKDGVTTHIGDTWSFTAQALTAYLPDPADGSNEASPSPILTWKAGTGATAHHLYFGSSRDAVAQGTTETDKGEPNFADANFAPGVLDNLSTYYWRVDELQADGTALTGSVWSFTTCILVDDFESYTNDVGSRIFQNWVDGWGYTEPAPGNAGNGTGMTVGHDIWTAGTAYTTIAETAIVHGGLQSMPLDYNNVNPPWYSETQREFAASENWTANDANTLVLYFRGMTANATAPLYVAIEDASRRSAVVVHSDPAAVKAPTWIQWKIPLSQFTGINLAAVKKLCIGIGDRKATKAGGTGRLFIDDVCVTKPAPAGQ